jgi:hypothetical protein
MEELLANSKGLWMFILDTSAFRNLFDVKVEYGESVLLKLLDSCELCIPIAVREEISEDLERGEFACSGKEKEEIGMILKNTRTLNFPEIEKECYNVLKRTHLKFQGLRKKADKQCVSLSLQLSRHEKYRFRGICLITDDTELFDIAQAILSKQFIGNTYFSFQILVFLSARRILRMTKFNLVDLLNNILVSYKKFEKAKEIRELLKEVINNICPYSCRYCLRCPFFSKF